MKLKAFALTLVFSLSFITSSAFAASTIYLPKDSEYQKQSMNLDRVLQLNSGKLQVSNDQVPSAAEAVWRLFVKACVPSVRNDRYAKTLAVQRTKSLLVLNFQCDNKTDFLKDADTIQFIATLNQTNELVDLQLIQFYTDSEKPASIRSDDPSDIYLKVGAGTLIKGLMAKDDQASENSDKILNSVAGSLVAVSSAALAYHGLNITKDQAYWIGVASGVLASMLKGAYDTYATNEINATDRIHSSSLMPDNIDFSFKISF